MAKGGWLLVIGVVILVVVAQQAGWLNFGGTAANNNAALTGNQATTPGPDNLQVTATINTKDALSPTDKDANISYYLFTKDGVFFKSGTTSAGTGSVVLNYGESYDMIAFSPSTYYPIKTSFMADSGVSTKIINLALNPVSNATISRVRDPIDLDVNVTVGLGTSVNFDLLYTTTLGSSMIHNPVVVVDMNQTSVTDVTIGSLQKVTCPTRITASTGRIKKCYQDVDLVSTSGIRTRSGNVQFSQSVAPATGDSLVFTVIDTQMYTEPNFVTKGISAFKESTENPSDYSNVGATDSNSATLYFNP